MAVGFRVMRLQKIVRWAQRCSLGVSVVVKRCGAGHAVDLVTLKHGCVGWPSGITEVFVCEMKFAKASSNIPPVHDLTESVLLETALTS